jgi:hypothetical protein
MSHHGFVLLFEGLVVTLLAFDLVELLYESILTVLVKELETKHVRELPSKDRAILTWDTEHEVRFFSSGRGLSDGGVDSLPRRQLLA